jgi:hypothetical protein
MCRRRRRRLHVYRAQRSIRLMPKTWAIVTSLLGVIIHDRLWVPPFLAFLIMALRI